MTIHKQTYAGYWLCSGSLKRHSVSWTWRGVTCRKCLKKKPATPGEENSEEKK